MARTVTQAFSIFITEQVNLVPDRTSVGRSSRDWLMNQLNNLPVKDETFPQLYSEKNIRYGSFARNTKIRPLDDIDLILAFHGSSAKYSQNIYTKICTINVPESSVKLYELCDEYGQLNSRRVVNKLVSSLGNIEHYKKAEIHRKQEAATLQLSSYEWNFDIVPAFYTSSGFYLIPDGNGQWKPTDPRIDQRRTNEVNSKHNGNALLFIRILKYWNKISLAKAIPTYLFENIIINYLNGIEAIGSMSYPPGFLHAFWSYLEYGIYNSVIDPKGFQGELNTLSDVEKNAIAAKTKQAKDYSYDAIMLAVERPDKAIDKWGKVFGGNFPSYG